MNAPTKTEHARQLRIRRAVCRFDLDEGRVKVAAAPCSVPPVGWQCTRAAGHDGPCAAWPKDLPRLEEFAAMLSAAIGGRIGLGFQAGGGGLGRY